MVTTEVINATSKVLSLKEGNAGVYRDIKVLQPTKNHIIEIDPNATYREYVVISMPGGDKVFVTSDDCIDNSKITILVKDGKFVFEGERRRQAKTTEEATGGFMKIPVISLRFEMRWRDRKVSLLFGLDGPQ